MKPRNLSDRQPLSWRSKNKISVSTVTATTSQRKKTTALRDDGLLAHHPLREIFDEKKNERENKEDRRGEKRSEKKRDIVVSRQEVHYERASREFDVAKMKASDTKEERTINRSGFSLELKNSYCGVCTPERRLTAALLGSTKVT